MKYFNFLAATLIATTLIATTMSANATAGVKSFSKEVFQQYSETEVYWEVSVNCNGNSEPRIVRRSVKGSDQWCSKALPEFCGRSKMNAARTICTSRYTKALNAAVSESQPETVKPLEVKTNSVPVQAPKPFARLEGGSVEDSGVSQEYLIEKNQVSIEEKRLDIEAQKLELRKRELELKKQEIELMQKQNLIRQ